MTRVALLRGVNVSGTNRLPMAGFRALLTGMGLDRVETYIQSGNAVFDSDRDGTALETDIAQAIGTGFGFWPAVFVVNADRIRQALTDHPFSDAAPERVHVFFLQQTPEALDTPDMQALAAPGDGWHLAPGRFTLHTPAGVGRSRLADKLHHFLPGPVTARNLRTIAALDTMLQRRRADLAGS
jgi:uncharacterized protein (DUF1697 family)